MGDDTEKKCVTLEKERVYDNREREKEYAVDDECKTRERMGVTSEREI